MDMEDADDNAISERKGKKRERERWRDEMPSDRHSRARSVGD